MTNVGMSTSGVMTVEQLSVSNPTFVTDPTDPTENIIDDDILPALSFNRNARAQSVRSTRSTTSRSSVNNLDGRVTCHDYHAEKYFSYRVRQHYPELTIKMKHTHATQSRIKALKKL
jgi:hypothetical protein